MINALGQAIDTINIILFPNFTNIIIKFQIKKIV